MHTRLLLPTFVHSLLVLALFSGLSITGASPILRNPLLPHARSVHLPRAALYSPPPPNHSPAATSTRLPSSRTHNHRQDRYIKPLKEAAAHYNLKFKKYSQWVKEQSKSLWHKHTTPKTQGSPSPPSSMEKETRMNSEGGYVSPYLTQFADKRDSWWSVGFNFGIMWRHVLWEVIPEWFRSEVPPKEDMFLLRAMEQPLYMSVDELPDVFKPPRMNLEQGGGDADIKDGKT